MHTPGQQEYSFQEELYGKPRSMAEWKKAQLPLCDMGNNKKWNIHKSALEISLYELWYTEDRYSTTRMKICKALTNTDDAQAGYLGEGSWGEH